MFVAAKESSSQENFGPSYLADDVENAGATVATTDTADRPISEGLKTEMSSKSDSTKHRQSQQADERQYEFRDDRLYVAGTSDLFHFDVYPSRADNQRNYERVGLLAIRHVYKCLVDAGLHCVLIPKYADHASHDSSASRTSVCGSGFVFASRSLLEDRCERLLVLINGSGAVRAGMWSRAIVINNSVEKGSQLPYVKRALEQDYGVLVLNTNLNYTEKLTDDVDVDNDELVDEAGEVVGGFRVDKQAWLKTRQSGLPICGSENPAKHGEYVWQHLVNNKKNLRNIAIVAHSAGGSVTVNLASKFGSDFGKRVFAVCLTDSVHSTLRAMDDNTRKHFLKVSRNWVGSGTPCGNQLSRAGQDVERVSAGDSRHEWTSHFAFVDVFKFLEKKLTKFASPNTEDQTLASTSNDVRKQVEIEMPNSGLNNGTWTSLSARTDKPTASIGAACYSQAASGKGESNSKRSKHRKHRRFLNCFSRAVDTE